jgi:hypothetical protein
VHQLVNKKTLIKTLLRVLSLKQYVNFKAVITKMYPWIPWEMVADLKKSTEPTLGTNALVDTLE